jgi:hypothetical protein
VAELLMSMQNHCVLNEGGSTIITHLFALTLGLSPALKELLLFPWGLLFRLHLSFEKHYFLNFFIFIYY